MQDSFGILWKLNSVTHVINISESIKNKGAKERKSIICVIPSWVKDKTKKWVAGRFRSI